MKRPILLLVQIFAFLSVCSLGQGDKERTENTNMLSLYYDRLNKTKAVWTENITNPLQPNTYDLSRQKEPFSWLISKTFWDKSNESDDKLAHLDSKKKEMKLKSATRPLANRHRGFNRPPFGKAVIGTPNVNNPVFFSSSARKPAFVGCSGRPCTLPPNVFYGPSRKWAPSFATVATPPHGWPRITKKVPDEFRPWKG